MLFTLFLNPEGVTPKRAVRKGCYMKVLIVN